MSPRETTAGREVRRKRNAERRLGEQAEVSPKVVLFRKALERRQKKRYEAAARLMSLVLDDVARERGGGYRYANLKLTNPEMAPEFHKGLKAALEGIGTEAKAEEVVREYNAKWIGEGRMVDCAVNLGHVPKAKVYGDGRVEVLRPDDGEAREIARRLRDLGVMG